MASISFLFFFFFFFFFSFVEIPSKKIFFLEKIENNYEIIFEKMIIIMIKMRLY